eukprot:SAG31_NODE_8245_length_1490_cov_1.662832_2_plen_73_part_01
MFAPRQGSGTCTTQYRCGGGAGDDKFGDDKFGDHKIVWGEQVCGEQVCGEPRMPDDADSPSKLSRGSLQLGIR